METALGLAILIFSIVLHEIAHGYVALRQGDPTARNSGRLTLNPIAHVDPVGSVLLPILLVLSHSPILLGWAKPVPINPGLFRRPARGIVLVGAAGPAANLLLAALAAALHRLLSPGGTLGLVLLSACVTNVVLALFNLVPIPPLDGSRVVVGLLPRRLRSRYLRLERYGFLLIILLLWTDVLGLFLKPAAEAVLRLLLGGRP